MESMSKRIPLYWINPRFRLNFPSFSVEWHLCDTCDFELNELYDKEILYTNQTKFENIRTQKWLRETIRDHVVLRAKRVLLQRLHELKSIPLPEIYVGHL